MNLSDRQREQVIENTAYDKGYKDALLEMAAGIKGTTYRPKSWRNPYAGSDKGFDQHDLEIKHSNQRIFEAGADAMLTHLRLLGNHWENFKVTNVAIPDDPAPAKATKRDTTRVTLKRGVCNESRTA